MLKPQLGPGSVSIYRNLLFDLKWFCFLLTCWKYILKRHFHLHKTFVFFGLAVKLKKSRGQSDLTVNLFIICLSSCNYFGANPTYANVFIVCLKCHNKFKLLIKLTCKSGRYLVCGQYVLFELNILLHISNQHEDVFQIWEDLWHCCH